MASRGQARRRPPRRRHRHAPLLRPSAGPSSRLQRGELRKLPGPAAAPWAAGGRRARPAGAWRPRARAPTPPAAAPAGPRRGVSRVAHADRVGALQAAPRANPDPSLAQARLQVHRVHQQVVHVAARRRRAGGGPRSPRGGGGGAAPPPGAPAPPPPAPPGPGAPPTWQLTANAPGSEQSRTRKAPRGRSASCASARPRDTAKPATQAGPVASQARAHCGARRPPRERRPLPRCDHGRRAAAQRVKHRRGRGHTRHGLPQCLTRRQRRADQEAGAHHPARPEPDTHDHS